MTGHDGWPRWLSSPDIGEGPLVRVTILAAKGSTPRDAGTVMLVDAARIYGTIGGGALEFAAEKAARAMLIQDDGGQPWRREVQAYALGPSLGQCCGGHIRLAFERLNAPELSHLRALFDGARAVRGVLVTALAAGMAPRLITERRDVGGLPPPVVRLAADMLSGNRSRASQVLPGSPDYLIEPLSEGRLDLFLYGAGHVGRALVHMARDLPLNLYWIDTDETRFPDPVPDHARRIAVREPPRFAAQAPRGGYHLVMTYSHPLDLAICHQLLQRGDFAYLGVIGSRTKRTRFLRRLTELGIPAATSARMACPIGLPDLKGKEPAAIALSALAEILRSRDAGAAALPGDAAAGDHG